MTADKKTNNLIIKKCLNSGIQWHGWQHQRFYVYRLYSQFFTPAFKTCMNFIECLLLLWRKFQRCGATDSAHGQTSFSQKIFGTHRVSYMYQGIYPAYF